ncbi:hypothetical protein ACFC1W_00240 [Microbacterium sp. NPDC056003]|uniref:hypothetical protein n=1 Tax=Microbacterium sp. NPDC056003 TaxID=3345676 RepID=UPI0035DFE80B
MAAQSAGVFEKGEGRQTRFFSVSSSRVASTWPTTAAPKQGNPTRTGCGVIASGAQMGRSPGYFNPSAAQCTTSVSDGTRTSPSAKRRRPGATERTCPRRTTSSMVRTRASSHAASVGVLAMVGSTVGSMRSMMPASSSRRNTSSGVVAAAAAAIVSAAIARKTAGSGWTNARLSIHGSRARTQVIALGSTPCCSSHAHVSVPVLPAPTTT